METPKNLLKGYIGESIAISRYTIYSDIARGENLIYVSKYFKEVIENEKKHAEIFANFIRKMDVEPMEIVITAPIKSESTAKNLRFAVEGEKLEAEELYPAEIAEKEGFEEVAKSVRTFAEVEKFHQRKFAKLLELCSKGMKRMNGCVLCAVTFTGKRSRPKFAPTAVRYHFVAKDVLSY